MVELQLQIDGYLERLVFSREKLSARLVEAMRYSLLAGGKRIRPVLALATADAGGHPPGLVLPLAAALEMIHTCSLVHDDLPAMHDDDLRRGRPTAHVAFGEDVALLAGDALFAEAIVLLLHEQEGDPALVLAATAELAAAAGADGLAGGQYIDVTATPELDERGLHHPHKLKTGRLLSAAVGTVLTLTGASGPDAATLRRFASEIGVLSQIVDDIIDATANEVTMGKPCGSDARHGRRTYISAFGLERARELARESHAITHEALAQATADTSALEQIANYVLTRDT